MIKPSGFRLKACRNDVEGIKGISPAPCEQSQKSFMNTHYIHQHDLNYPSARLKVLGGDAPEGSMAMGNSDILQNKKVALFCSAKCPGKFILQTYDLAKQWLKERITVENAIIRNRFVAALADSVCVAYAEPGGKTEQFCREIISWGKDLFTFEGKTNANLIELGAQPTAYSV